MISAGKESKPRRAVEIHGRSYRGPSATANPPHMVPRDAAGARLLEGRAGGSGILTSNSALVSTLKPWVVSIV